LKDATEGAPAAACAAMERLVPARKEAAHARFSKKADFNMRLKSRAIKKRQLGILSLPMQLVEHAAGGSLGFNEKLTGSFSRFGRVVESANERRQPRLSAACSRENMKVKV